MAGSDMHVVGMAGSDMHVMGLAGSGMHATISQFHPMSIHYSQCI